MPTLQEPFKKTQRHCGLLQGLTVQQSENGTAPPWREHEDWQLHSPGKAGHAGALVVHAPGEPTAIYSRPGPSRDLRSSVPGAGKLGEP